MQTSNQTLEILAPAGSMDALIAAVRSGANAVYLGGDAFNARGNAKNFDRTQLREAVEYCHLAGVAVHLAVNTLLFDSELPQALDLVAYACTLPVDGIIVQDWGLFSLLRDMAPTLPLHCSTQMSIHTPAGAVCMAKEGADRVVLSRELSLEEIKEISDRTPVEIEHFVHGALCMSVSGQCYLSGMLGSRSGNRGLCAQPCRLPFGSVGGTGHDLSLKDLSMIARLDELRDAGVDSCKIEGRMKRPEYVAAATAACRYAADGAPIPTDLMENLEAVFSRSGFTTGYPDAKRGRDMFGTRTYEDVTGASKEVFSALQQFYQKETQRVAIDMTLTVTVGEPITLTVTDQDGNAVTVPGMVAEQAQNRPLDPERAEVQMKKTGGTVFYVRNYTGQLDGQAALPVSALNELRRTALEQLTELRRHHAPIPCTAVTPKITPYTPKQPMALRLHFTRVDESSKIPDRAKDCELVFVPLLTEDAVLTDLLARGIPVAIAIPRGMFGREALYRERLQQVKALGITHGWAGNIGAVPLLQEAGFTIHGGFSLNVTNTASLQFLESLGIADQELSFEGTFGQLSRIGGTVPRGILLYGRMPVMLTRNCPAANNPNGCKGCVNSSSGCGQPGTRPAGVTDRKGITFPVQCERKGGIQTFNSVPLMWSDKLSEIPAFDFGTLWFSVENSVEIDEILINYTQKQPVKGSFTRGLYRRGVD